MQSNTKSQIYLKDWEVFVAFFEMLSHIPQNNLQFSI